MTDKGAGGRSVGVTEEQQQEQEAEITDGVQANLRRRLRKHVKKEQRTKVIVSDCD